MTQSDIDTINSWVNSSRDYADGLNLLVKHTKNQSLRRIYEGREHRYANKLLYEVKKLANSPVQPSVIQVNQPAQSKVAAAASKPVPVRYDLQNFVPDPNLPAIIVRLIAEFSDKYKQRSMAHGALKKLPPDNRQVNIDYRKILVDKILGYSDRMDELQSYHNDYTNLGTIPDESVLYPIKKTVAEDSLPDKREALVTLRLNVRKCLNRYNNQLNFQTSTRQSVKNPMPAGPKRTALLAKIKESNIQLAKLDQRIVGMSKIIEELDN